MLITFTLNGQSQTVESNTTVSMLLAGLPLPARFVVEKNQRLIPKPQWSEIFIEDNDKIEIITAVGGG